MRLMRFAGSSDAIKSSVHLRDQESGQCRQGRRADSDSTSSCAIELAAAGANRQPHRHLRGAAADRASSRFAMLAQAMSSTTRSHRAAG